MSVVSVCDFDLSDSIPLALAEGIIIVLIKFRLDVGSEIGVREVGSVNGNGALRDDRHVQGKGITGALAAIVEVGHFGRARVHRQSVAAHGAAVPSGGLGHVKCTGEGAQVKGAVAAHRNRIGIAQCKKFRTAIVDIDTRVIHIQAGQVVIIGFKLEYLVIPAQIQFRQLVVAAIQTFQVGILAHIQFRQLVDTAVQ